MKRCSSCHAINYNHEVQQRHSTQNSDVENNFWLSGYIRLGTYLMSFKNFDTWDSLSKWFSKGKLNLY